MKEDTELAYDKEWLEEFDRVLASLTIPCVEYTPPLEQPKSISTITQNILTEDGNMYYTLKDDYQFAVTADHPRAKGWRNG
jgi:hypothetical protein